MQTEEQEPVFLTNSTDVFFRKRYITTWAFALGLLLFLLPFSQVKCGTATLAENSGLGIAMGWQWKIAMIGSSNELLKALKKDEPDNKNSLKEKPNVFAIVAILAGLIGLVISVIEYKNRSLVTMCPGCHYAHCPVGSVQVGFAVFTKR